MRKLNAVVKFLKSCDEMVVSECIVVVPVRGSDWEVTVTDMDTKDEYVLTIEAETEKDAAFKAMEQINDQ